MTHGNRIFYQNSKVNIQNIFEIARTEERANFNKSVGNEKVNISNIKIITIYNKFKNA